MEEDRIYLNPGDIVTLRQDLPNKPIMLVVKKETSLFKHDPKHIQEEKPILIGIRCRWFTLDQVLQEAVFSTKDLVKL